MRASQAVGPSDDTSLNHRDRVAFQLYWAHLAALFGIALSNILLGLTILTTPWTTVRERLARPAVRPLLVALLAHVVLLLVSVIASTAPRTSARELSELFNLMVLPLCLVLARDIHRLRLLTDAITLLATVEALLGLSQLVATGGNLDDRIRGSLSHYMTFSGVLLVADLFLLARAATGLRMGWIRWMALVPINIALVGSLTRSAWVGLIAGSLCLVFARRRRGLLVLAALLLLATLSPGVPVAQRIRSIVDPADSTNYDRLCMAYAGVQMSLQRPATGLGPLLVRDRYPIFRHPTAPREQVPHLHNTYLQLAAERGLPAAAVFIGMMGLGLVRARRFYRVVEGDPEEGADLALGAFAILVALAVAAMFEYNWGDTEVQRLMLVALAVPFALMGPEEAAARRRGGLRD